MRRGLVGGRRGTGEGDVMLMNGSEKLGKVQKKARCGALSCSNEAGVGCRSCSPL